LAAGVAAKQNIANKKSPCAGYVKYRNKRQGPIKLAYKLILPEREYARKYLTILLPPFSNFFRKR